MAHPELLAPAGNMECLHAAVRAGADAVYLGLDRLNARRGADNFTLDTLEEACDWAHVRGTKVYVTVNTAVLPGEFEPALELVRQAWRRGADAFIVQDVGLATELRAKVPQARLHASTQMNIHDAAGLAAAVQLGASRVTLARELNLEEIAYLAQEAASVHLEVETFVHGAICVCYSGQCLLSSLVGGRSANRGMCAQACRLPYELHNAAQRKPLDAPGDYLLSPKDLCAVDLLGKLVQAGVSSFKIEGRMKSADYVYTVTGAYRRSIDRALERPDRKHCVTPKDLHALEESFSRGFTTAYMTGDDGPEMMSFTRPNNRGVAIGRVARAEGGMVELDCTRPVAQGDVLEFWTNRGHFAHTVGAFEDLGNFNVRMKVERAVGKGDRVFRVRSAAAAYADDPQAARRPIAAQVRLKLGEPAWMLLRCADGTFAEAFGPVVEAARTKAITQEEVEAHVSRFGNSPFFLRQLAVTLDEGVGMGFSALHALRAQATEALEQAILEPYHTRQLERAPRTQEVHPTRFDRRGQLLVCAWATNPACARAARKAGADVVYVPALNYKRGEAVIAGQKSETAAQAGYPNKCVVALPVATHEALPGTREDRFGFDAWDYVHAEKPVYADSIGALVRAAKQGALPEAGWHIPATNAATVQALADLGATRVWLSPELTLGQIQQIGEEVEVPLGLWVSGAAELMVTEHCLLTSQGPCNRDCSTCARRKSPHYVKDRKGFELPVITDLTGRSHLYNAVPLDVLHALPDLVAAHVGAFMVDTTLLNTEETAKTISRAVRARNLAQKSGNAVGKAEGTTAGHLFRGVQ